MRYFNICSKRAVQTPEGSKNIFNKIGIVKVHDNGAWFMQLYQNPKTDYQIFPSQDEELPVIES